MIQNSKRIWVVVGAVVVLLIILYISKPNMNTLISRDQVASSEMSITVYTKVRDGAKISNEVVALSRGDINRIVGWINSALESARTSVDNVSESIIAGIALKLKYNAEVRIQYDLKDIYITQTRMFNRDSRYILDQKDLRDFMDQKLEGTYFGEDPVSDE